MLRHPGKPLAFALIALTFAMSPLARAENGSPQSQDLINFNPNFAPSFKKPEDRKDEAKAASNKAQQSIPPLMQKAGDHNNKAQQHRKKADQMQQSDPGGAEEERKKAAMEAMKAQQLQQQAQQNKKNADDNQKASDAAKSNEQAQGKQFGGLSKVSSKVDENKVIMVDEGRKPTPVPAAEKSTTVKNEAFDGNEKLQKELATFEDYVTPEKPVEFVSAEATSLAETAGGDKSFLRPEWEAALTNGGGSLAEAKAAGEQLIANSNPAQAGSPAGLFGGGTPTILGGLGGGKDALDKNFFKDKEDKEDGDDRDGKGKKKGKKKKNARAGRALASKWKGTMVRRVEAEPDGGSANQAADEKQGDVPLPNSGKLKD